MREPQGQRGDGPPPAPLRARADGRARRGLAFVAPAVSALLACVREAEPSLCPDVEVGELVVTELRGPQASPNSRPQWIELANVSERAVDLEGLHLVLVKLDGSGELDMLVRYKRTLAAGDYYVLGFVPDNERPQDIDYGLAAEHDGDLYVDGLLTIDACGETIDKVDYRDLPDAGTWSLGLAPPTADGNDMDAAWCVDDEPAADGAMTMLGLPGTPGEANRPCM